MYSGAALPGQGGSGSAELLAQGRGEARGVFLDGNARIWEFWGRLGALRAVFLWEQQRSINPWLSEEAFCAFTALLL